MTPQRQAERDLEESERRYEALVDQLPAIVYTAEVTATGRWHFVSHQVATMLGYSPEEWMADPSLWVARLHPDDRDRVVEAKLAVEVGEQFESEYRLCTRGGEVVWVRDEAVKTRLPNGAVVLAGLMLDVTSARKADAAVAEEHAQLQAIIDHSPAMIFTQDRQHRIVLANGAVARTMGLSRDEMIGRTEADFLSAEEAARVWEDNEQVMASGEGREFEESIPDPGGRGRRTFIIQKFPLRDAQGEVYGLGAVLTDISERKRREEELNSKVAWASRIRDAIASDQFTLHAQPIIALSSGERVQEELLLRLVDQDGELVMPGEFLPQAERFGLAPEIDRWVVSKAAAMAKHRRVEVNLSGKSIGDPTLPSYIEVELAAARADPANVVFEITETAAAEDFDQARRLAARLTRLGCGFALDDFGTGYGSFTYLKNLPVSFIKIDYEFVRKIAQDDANHRVVHSMIGVAHDFGIETIAEGVESAETLDLLTEMGVDYAQGFHIGRPAPAIAG